MLGARVIVYRIRTTTHESRDSKETGQDEVHSAKMKGLRLLNAKVGRGLAAKYQPGAVDCQVGVAQTIGTTHNGLIMPSSRVGCHSHLEREDRDDI